ncbi:hypothetical protein AWC38_SpisGene21206 [Stylophora pistillata]|uniref:Rho termination factor N-terminal domain-containing protein n=1 Tax=Stylophora pistillata TaxID=50429 RepID=A0A2B4RAD9_STYPI|nr:hypothetical protein AWC38_SpisGene21206 [Stylophora pistillata]
MDELEYYSRSALLEKAKEMGLKRCSLLKKKELIELIRNPPDVNSLESLSRKELHDKTKEMGLQGCTAKGKKELIELIRNPQETPVSRARHIGVRKRVILRSLEDSSDESDSPELFFPSINSCARHFNVNPGRFAAKMRARNERGSLLDDPIPALEIPKGQDILKPSPPTPPPKLKRLEKKIDEAVKFAKNKVEDWGKWLKDQAERPNAPRVVDDALKSFKDHINELYKNSDQYRFKLVEAMSSLKGFAKMFTIDGVGGFSPLDFLKAVKSTVVNFLLTQKNLTVKFVLRCNMGKTNIATGETVLQDAHFNSSQKIVFQDTDREEIYQECVDKMMESLATFTRNGSGWTVNSVDGLDLHTVKYTPLKGSSFIPLPQHLANKKAIINMKNGDQQCFMWCVTRALNPVERDQERISKTLRKQALRLKFDGINFPMEVKDISRFERLNPGLGVNVYMYEGGLNPLRVSEAQNIKTHIDLLLICDGEKTHYCLIKSLSRLISCDLSKKKSKKFLCRRCLNYFGSQKLLDTHDELCRDHDAVREKMPDKESFLYFKNHHKKMDMPFVIYADFESIIKPLHTCQPNPDDCYTEKKQQHIPVSFCYYVKCSFDDNHSKLFEYTAKSEDEDVAQIFVEMLEEEVKAIYKDHPPKEMIFTDSDAEIFENATCCWICGEDFNMEDERHRDHDHYTGKFRGAAHNSCNLRFQRPKFTPVVFHNLANYDAHLFVRNLGVSEGEINCIPNNEEKYISFSEDVVVDKFFDEEKKKNVVVKRQLRFIDSFKFMASSVDKLVGNLSKKSDSFENTRRYFRGEKKLDLVKRKGVYPYEWMSSIEKLDETELPPRSAFFSVLSAPGLSWDACLKKTGVELELLSDPGMLHMFEKGIRGGISMICTRHAMANNKYMGEKFDPTQPSKFIEYLDMNNLYGAAMRMPLPTGGFKWGDKKDYKDWEDYPCILEVDLPRINEELHDYFNDYPLAPENLLVEKVPKLVCTLNEKKKYIVHHETLKLYKSLGIEIGKIHRIIRFDESPWMREYIDLNTELRAKADNDFEKDFHKLMNNSCFGKTMENIRKRVDVRLVNSQEKAGKLANKVNFKHCTIFSEDLCAIEMRKTQIYFIKPLYLGMSILDLSKTLMYDFHYNFIKPKYEDRAKLLFTDTDSLCYEIQTEDFYKDISSDVECLFDTSNIPKDHPSGIPTGVNKKVVGMMKDEAGGKIIEEFVGLRAKLYSYKMFDGKEEKKCKGVKTGVVKRTINFDDYKRCLFGGGPQLRKINTLRSRKHEMFMEEINKVALSADDDKRIILPDKINTYAIGHYRSE